MGSGVFNPTPYREVTLKCTQATTAAPAIAYTLGNTFGQSIVNDPIVPTRTGEGVFVFTLASLFTAHKTVVIPISNVSASVVFYVVYTSADAFTLHCYDAATPSAADCEAFDLIIRVYD
jgi:hypothetical protein